jgi:hypothetical protein
MTPDPEEARARVLLTALGFALVALAAVGGLLALGLKRSEPHEVVQRPSRATVSALNAERTQERRSSAVGARDLTGQLFAPSSFWNKRLGDGAPLDPSSATLVQAFTTEIQRERAASIGPWIGAGAGSTPLYRVPQDQPRVRVVLDTSTSRGAKALRRAFASVPIPRNAKPAPGLDGHLTVWQPSTDRLWELFHARRERGVWHADWGGAIRNVSKSPGYYTANAWPGATRNWGATASSLPIVGGTILLSDLQRGRIDHALALNLPAPRAGEFAWPAQRTDGTGPPTALPEGARMRLDPAVNINDLALPKLGRMIARAAQRYGMVVRDQTHHGTSLWAEVVPTGSRRSLGSYLKDKTPAELLANFPWDRLQVLAMHVCKAAPCDEP